jgi:protein-disulfide isomerase
MSRQRWISSDATRDEEEQMKIAVAARAGSTALLLGVVLAPRAAAQAPPTDDLRKDIQELRETLRAIQKDLQEVKAMLARPPAPPSPVNQIIDLGDNPARGDRSAKLTLVEFSDYQCPYCGQYVRATYPQIEAEYIKTGKLKSVFVDVPLENIHKSAFKAAEAAHCAGDQGKYWEMHDRLFENQKTLEPWNAHAEAVGLEMAAFEQCMASGKFAPEVRRDMGEARKVGVTGTPAFMLARTDPASSKVRVLAALRGAQPFASFKAEIDRVLAAEAAPGPPGDEKK